MSEERNESESEGGSEWRARSCAVHILLVTYESWLTHRKSDCPDVPFSHPLFLLFLGHVLTVPYDKVNSHIRQGLTEDRHRHTTCARLSPLADHLFVYLFGFFQHDRYIHVCVLACLYVYVSPAWSPPYFISYVASLPFPFQFAAKVEKVRRRLSTGWIVSLLLPIPSVNTPSLLSTSLSPFWAALVLAWISSSCTNASDTPTMLLLLSSLLLFFLFVSFFVLHLVLLPLLLCAFTCPMRFCAISIGGWCVRSVNE